MDASKKKSHCNDVNDNMLDEYTKVQSEVAFRRKKYCVVAAKVFSRSELLEIDILKKTKCILPQSILNLKHEKCSSESFDELLSNVAKMDMDEASYKSKVSQYLDDKKSLQRVIDQRNDMSYVIDKTDNTSTS